MAKKTIYSHASATFNGSNEYISRGGNLFNYQHYANPPGVTVGITAWAWIKLTDTGNNWILGNWCSTAGDNGWGISTKVTTGLFVGELWHDEAGGEGIRVESDVAVNDGEWHLVCMSYDGTDGASAASNFILYVDGIPVASTIVTDNLTRVGATGILTSTAIPNDGDTVTIGTPTIGGVKVYTFQTSLTDVDGNVDIGGSQAQAMENLRRAINLDGVAGTNYATSMTLHPDLSATDTGTTVDVTANVPTSLPSVGNEITTTEVSGVMSWGGATLSGADNRTTSTGTIYPFHSRKGFATLQNYFAGQQADSGHMYRALTQSEVLELWGDGAPTDPKAYSFASDLASYGAWFNGGNGGEAWDGGDAVLKRRIDLLNDLGTWPATFGAPNSAGITGFGTDSSMEVANNYDFDGPFRGFLNVISLTFDGTDDYVDMGDVHDFERTDSFSIELWFNTSTGAIQALACKGDVAATAGYEVSMDASGSVHFFATNTSGGTDELNVRTTATGFDDGGWHHCIVTYGGTSTPAGCHIWIDKVDEPLTTVSDTLSASIDNADPLRLGARSDGADRYTGDMCQVAFYDRVLLEADVIELWGDSGPVNKAASTVWPSLIGWWNLGSGDTAATIVDRASSMVGGNDGTTAGSPALSNSTPGPTPYSPLTKSIIFDGVDGFPGEHIDFGQFAEADFERTDKRTVNIWVKINGGGNDRIMGRGNVTGWNFKFDAGVASSVSWQCRSATEDLNLRSIPLGGAPSLDDGDWHMVTGVLDGQDPLTHSDIELYIDGVLLTTAAGTVQELGSDITTTTSVAQDLFVAEGSTGGANANMTACHPSIHAFAMTPSEVRELYGNGQPQDLDSLSFASPTWWSALGDGDTLGTDGVLDLISTNHGTAENLEASDFQGDVPEGTELANAFNAYGFLYFTEDQYIDCGDVATFAFDNTDPFSLECWFRTHSVTETTYIMSKMESAGTGRGYYLFINTGGVIIFNRRNTTTTDEARIDTASSGFWDGAWHHLVATTDGTNAASGMSIYIDGQLQPVTPINDTLSATMLIAAPFQIGNRDSSTTDNFNGDFADVAVYDKELSAAEVVEHYNSSDPGDLLEGGSPTNRHKLSTEASLVAWYPFAGSQQGASTFEVMDHAINSYNHGTFSGDIPGLGQIYDDGPGGSGSSVNWSASGEVSGPPGPGSSFTVADQIQPQGMRLPSEMNDGLGFLDSEVRGVHDDLNTPGGTWLPSGGAAPGTLTYFKMRGVDNNGPNYTTWVVTDDPDPDGIQATGGNTDPPLVGSIVAGSGIVAATWQT